MFKVRTSGLLNALFLVVKETFFISSSQHLQRKIFLKLQKRPGPKPTNIKVPEFLWSSEQNILFVIEVA